MTNEEHQGYGGWSNYETWNAVLWLSNDEPAYRATMNQIVFTVTQQHKKGAGDYDVALAAVARRSFGSKTPDNVVLTPAKTKVNWTEAVGYFQEVIDGLEAKWLDVLERLHLNAQGGFVGITEAASDFRKQNHY